MMIAFLDVSRLEYRMGEERDIFDIPCPFPSGRNKNHASQRGPSGIHANQRRRQGPAQNPQLKIGAKREPDHRNLPMKTQTVNLTAEKMTVWLDFRATRTFLAIAGSQLRCVAYESREQGQQSSVSLRFKVSIMFIGMMPMKGQSGTKDTVRSVPLAATAIDPQATHGFGLGNADRGDLGNIIVFCTKKLSQQTQTETEFRKRVPKIGKSSRSRWHTVSE